MSENSDQRVSQYMKINNVSKEDCKKEEHKVVIMNALEDILLYEGRYKDESDEKYEQRKKIGVDAKLSDVTRYFKGIYGNELEGLSGFGIVYWVYNRMKALEADGKRGSNETSTETKNISDDKASDITNNKTTSNKEDANMAGRGKSAEEQLEEMKLKEMEKKDMEKKQEEGSKVKETETQEQSRLGGLADEIRQQYAQHGDGQTVENNGQAGNTPTEDSEKANNTLESMQNEVAGQQDDGAADNTGTNKGDNGKLTVMGKETMPKQDTATVAMTNNIVSASMEARKSVSNNTKVEKMFYAKQPLAEWLKDGDKTKGRLTKARARKQLDSFNKKFGTHIEADGQVKFTWAVDQEAATKVYNMLKEAVDSPDDNYTRELDIYFGNSSGVLKGVEIKDTTKNQAEGELKTKEELISFIVNEASLYLNADKISNVQFKVTRVSEKRRKEIESKIASSNDRTAERKKVSISNLSVLRIVGRQAAVDSKGFIEYVSKANKTADKLEEITSVKSDLSAKYYATTKVVDENQKETIVKKERSNGALDERTFRIGLNTDAYPVAAVDDKVKAKFPNQREVEQTMLDVNDKSQQDNVSQALKLIIGDLLQADINWTGDTKIKNAINAGKAEQDKKESNKEDKFAAFE